jgi:hypothetical protein
VDPKDEDDRSNSGRQLTFITPAHGANGPTSRTKKNTAVSDMDGAMIEKLVDHWVGLLGELDAWLSIIGVSFGKMLEDLVNRKKIEKSVGAVLLIKYHEKGF